MKMCAICYGVVPACQGKARKRSKCSRWCANCCFSGSCCFSFSKDGAPFDVSGVGGDIGDIHGVCFKGVADTKEK